MNILKIFPFIKLEVFNNEYCFVVKTNLLSKALFLFKNHFKYQFKVLTCISGVDYPNNHYRFTLVYELLSIRFNSRIRVKCFVNELIPVVSVREIFLGAAWWECEVWDMFGVFFSDHPNLVRLLTDYGFEGYPLRKDFPLSGFYESRYSYSKHRVVYGDIELCQEYRTFEFPSPWEKN
uniref:NADH dehydrogenase subunit 9 n=1 Tax=Haslea karadagensis TaxID=1146996 RepID=UPI0021F9B873|nr:NADH dehydrogenase subunit 9 [Haslea karadagensis]UXN44264.1 NADH dehydrogenase subunit 9 [Haslea karadagensis]UXN44305.1 NADH dehydrogenase subunit 9 [Haslea karadagensis]UXN44345.1 NADH dehydrogenase subunit 9 [Haslea karadagensis]